MFLVKSIRDYMELNEEETAFLDNFQKLSKEDQDLMIAAMMGDVEAIDTLKAFYAAHRHELEK